MTYTAYSSTRSLLASNTNITNYIPSTYIRVGFQESNLYIPSITLHQAGGSSYGYLGYGSGKLMREENTMQINIFHRWTMLSSQVIGDLIEDSLVSNGWYRKISDRDDYSNDLNCYLKTQLWSYKQNVQY